MASLAHANSIESRANMLTPSTHSGGLNLIAGQRDLRAAKMYAALSATNEAILRINSKEKLFQQVCEAALQSGSFIAAVILLREPRSDTLKAAAGAGNDADLRARTYSASASSPLGNGLV